MSSRAVTAQDYNTNVLASSLQQRQQQYQASHQPEIRRPFGLPEKAELKQNVPVIKRDP